MLDVLSPYYMQIKLLHLLAVMVWLFSTAVAYQNYLVPAFKAWLAAPDRRPGLMCQFVCGHT